MFITKELLERHGACTSGVEFFAKHFPDGCEASEFLKLKHVPLEMLHWGHTYLDISEEDEQAYFSIVQAINSHDFNYSDHLENSSFVSHSSNVKNSNYIFFSNDVSDSDEVNGSETVEKSKKVVNSRLVFDSRLIAHSTNVTNSTNIVRTNYVVDSTNIFESDLITDCNTVRRSSNMTHCLFCANCKNLKHSLFSTLQEDGEFLLFNKPIESVHYYNIMKIFDRSIKSVLDVHLMRQWVDKPLEATFPVVNFDLRKHYENLSKKFLQWARTLPNYNPNIMYELTYRGEFIKK